MPWALESYIVVQLSRIASCQFRVSHFLLGPPQVETMRSLTKCELWSCGIVIIQELADEVGISTGLLLARI